MHQERIDQKPGDIAAYLKRRFRFPGATDLARRMTLAQVNISRSKNRRIQG
jgi:hypothetical protein